MLVYFVSVLVPFFRPISKDKLCPLYHLQHMGYSSLDVALKRQDSLLLFPDEIPQSFEIRVLYRRRDPLYNDEALLVLLAAKNTGHLQHEVLDYSQRLLCLFHEVLVEGHILKKLFDLGGEVWGNTIFNNAFDGLT